MVKQCKVSFSINSVTLVDAALIEEFLTSNNIPFELGQVYTKPRKNGNGTGKPRSKRQRLVMADVKLVQKLVKQGHADSVIHRKTGFSHGSIWRIRNGKHVLLNK